MSIYWKVISLSGGLAPHSAAAETRFNKGLSPARAARAAAAARWLRDALRGSNQSQQGLLTLRPRGVVVLYPSHPRKSSLMNSSSRGARGPLRARPLKGVSQGAARSAGWPRSRALAHSARKHQKPFHTCAGWRAPRPGSPLFTLIVKTVIPATERGQRTFPETRSRSGKARPPATPGSPPCAGVGSAPRRQCASARNDGRVPSRVRGQMLLAMFSLLTRTRVRALLSRHRQWPGLFFNPRVSVCHVSCSDAIYTL